jgi:MOSC domain-containing protein YiiM
MKLISVNVALPRDVIWKGRTVTTGIYKEPVSGTIHVGRLNLDGDRQADLTVHGGEEKAVYVYPAEHYDHWRIELPEMELPWGMFGENFTVSGLSEDEVKIGDRFRIGSATLSVTQPRMPCYKLGIKFGRDDMVKRFLKSGRTGFYFSVSQEGDVTAGDAIQLVESDPGSLLVSDITRLYVNHDGLTDLRQRASELEALPTNWRGYFKKQLANESPG